MTAVLIGLIVGAALWVVLFTLLLIFSGGDWGLALSWASATTIALAVIVAVVAGAGWLVALVLA